PDASSSAVNLSATSGKVALVTNQTPLTCGGSTGSCSSSASIHDFVGYGSANNFEGKAAPALSATLAAARANGGCTDTNNHGPACRAVAAARGTSATAAAPCRAPAPDAGAGDAGAGGPIGNDGGTLPQLHFAVVGDTRPPNKDDTAGYPTAIITQIFED